MGMILGSVISFCGITYLIKQGKNGTLKKGNKNKELSPTNTFNTALSTNDDSDKYC